MPSNSKTRSECTIEIQDRISRAEQLLRTGGIRFMRSEVRLRLAADRQLLATFRFPDGLYRVEFTAGEDRPGIVKALDFFVEVMDGPAKGKCIPESLSLAWSGVAGGANRQKLAAYAATLNIESNKLDREEWLFRPFIAEVVDERIVAIRGEDGAAVYLPAAADPVRELVWHADGGWDFAPANPERAAA